MKRRIEQAAKKHAEVIFYNEEKAEAFAAGAVWCAKKFYDMLDLGAYYHGAPKDSKKMMVEATLQHFIKQVEEVMKMAKDEPS